MQHPSFVLLLLAVTIKVRRNFGCVSTIPPKKGLVPFAAFTQNEKKRWTEQNKTKQTTTKALACLPSLQHYRRLPFLHRHHLLLRRPLYR